MARIARLIRRRHAQLLLIQLLIDTVVAESPDGLRLEDEDPDDLVRTCSADSDQDSTERLTTTLDRQLWSYGAKRSGRTC